jgi:hypothetical protein
MCIGTEMVYTGEDLKWDTPPWRSKRGRISNRYRYPTLDELKWDILHLLSFQTPIIHNKRIYYLYNRHPIPTLYHI